MGKIGLKIKVNMNNVDKLYPLHPKQFGWALKVKCTGCGEENPNWHVVSEEDEFSLVKATANFVYKCKCCSRENSLTIIPLSQNNKKNKSLESKEISDFIYLDSDEDTYKTIIAFDCRGLELIDYEPRDGWAIQSGKKTFDDVNLSSMDWYDYNDIDNVPVEITNFEFKFEGLK